MTDAKLIEAMAQAIYDADNGIDGDTIATMIQENFRIEVYGDDKGLPGTLAVCREAARAALSAAEEAGYAIVPREPTEAMIRKALASTSHWRDIPGSALTVNREKMRIRWYAMLAAYSPIPPHILDWAASQAEAIETEKEKPGYDTKSFKSLEEMQAEGD